MKAKEKHICVTCGKELNSQRIWKLDRGGKPYECAECMRDREHREYVIKKRAMFGEIEIGRASCRERV